MAVSADTGRFVANGSSGADDSGICGRAGFESLGFQDADSRGGAAELQCKPTVKGMAVRICVEDPNTPGTGASLHGYDRDDVADRHAESRSHDAMAVLAGQSGRDQKTVQAVATD